MTLAITNLNIAYSHGKVAEPAVSDFSLNIGSREKVAIVGESGSGKSTVANAIMGLLPNNSVIEGSITLDQRELIGSAAHDWYAVRGARIGYVPQDPMLSLNEVWTIGYHFHETISAHHIVSRSQWKALARERLAEVGLQDGERILRQYPHQLSGGMRQRVLIALALLCRPQLVVADEPTSALDVVVQRQILDLLDELTKHLATSLVLITHDLGLVADHCERVAVMDHGKLIEEGSTHQVITCPSNSYTRRLIEAVPKLSSASIRPVMNLDDKLPVLEIKHLNKAFRLRSSGLGIRRMDSILACNDVSFSVRRGECLALVGESGSGKSTIAKTIVGLEKPTSGDIFIDGKNRNKLNSKELNEQAKHIQIVFQDPYASLDPQFTVLRTLLEPLSVHRSNWTNEQRLTRIYELLDLVNLDSRFSQRYPNELSGGQRQRVAIARALATSPDILVLDEAVSALDVVVQAQILDTLRSLREHLNLSMLFITHDLAVVAEIADTVSVINHGVIVESGPVSSVFANPTNPYTKELLEAVPGRDYF